MSLHEPLHFNANLQGQNVRTIRAGTWQTPVPARNRLNVQRIRGVSRRGGSTLKLPNGHPVARSLTFSREQTRGSCRRRLHRCPKANATSAERNDRRRHFHRSRRRDIVAIFDHAACRNGSLFVRLITAAGRRTHEIPTDSFQRARHGRRHPQEGEAHGHEAIKRAHVERDFSYCSRDLSTRHGEVVRGGILRQCRLLSKLRHPIA